jgi:hypothetical protein
MAVKTPYERAKIRMKDIKALISALSGYKIQKGVIVKLLGPVTPLSHNQIDQVTPFRAQTAIVFAWALFGVCQGTFGTGGGAVFGAARAPSAPLVAEASIVGHNGSRP